MRLILYYVVVSLIFRIKLISNENKILDFHIENGNFTEIFMRFYLENGDVDF